MPSRRPRIRPYEFENTPEGHEIALALARALCNGTLCLYIRPNEEGVSYYRDTWGYGQLVYQEHALIEIAAFRSLLKGWMIKGEVPGQPRIAAAEADRILHERLGQCYVSRSPMWMPGVSSSMIGWTHARELKSRMTISLPGARFGGMLVYPRYLTLEFRFLRFLRAVVLETCKEIQAGKEGRTEGRVQIAAPEDEANLKIHRAVLPEVLPTAAVGLQHRAGRGRPQLTGAARGPAEGFLNKFACNHPSGSTTSVLTRSSPGLPRSSEGWAARPADRGARRPLVGDRWRNRLLSKARLPMTLG